VAKGAKGANIKNIVTMKIAKNKIAVDQICKILYLPFSQVTFLPGSDRFHKKMLVKGGQLWNEIYFTPGTAEFEQKEKDDKGGILIEQTLKLVFPGQDQGNNLLLDALRIPSIVLLKMVSGYYLVFGSPENPVRMLKDAKNTQKAFNSELALSCTASENAWELEIVQGSPPIED
jgi:hypothetical protein